MGILAAPRVIGLNEIANVQDQRAVVAPRVGALGDGSTSRSFLTSAVSFHWQTNGILTWAKQLVGNRAVFRYEDVYASSGKSTSAAIASEWHTTLANSNVDFVVVAIGGNDPDNSISLSTTLSNLEIIYNTILAGDKEIIAVTLPQRTSSTTARLNHYKSVNSWIQQKARLDRRIHVVDVTPYLSDATNATGEPLSSRMPNGTNYNAQGAYYVGKLIANILISKLPYIDDLFSSAGDTYDATDNRYGNLLTNGILNGTGGSVGTGGTITGNIATGWTVNGATSITTTCSKVARTDGISASWQQLAISGTPGSTAQINFQQTVSTNLTAGDVVEAMMEYEVDTGFSNVLAVCLDLGTSGTMRAMDPIYESAVTTELIVDPGVNLTGVSRTRPVTVPSSLTGGLILKASVFLPASVAASVTARFGRISLRKIY